MGCPVWVQIHSELPPGAILHGFLCGVASGVQLGMKGNWACHTGLRLWHIRPAVCYSVLSYYSKQQNHCRTGDVIVSKFATIFFSAAELLCVWKLMGGILMWNWDDVKVRPKAVKHSSSFFTHWFLQAKLFYRILLPTAHFTEIKRNTGSRNIRGQIHTFLILCKSECNVQMFRGERNDFCFARKIMICAH